MHNSAPSAVNLDRRSFCYGLTALPFAGHAGAQSHPGSSGPLQSWNDGEVKRTIISFVQETTDPRSTSFIAPADRIAAFDNDGTLWVEKPLPNEVYFILEQLRQLTAKDPSLAHKQPYKAALTGDAAYFHEAGASAIAELFMETHSGMSQEMFAEDARRFMTRARHPKFGCTFTALTYQPMLELLGYLRANGFQTWLCSGGDSDFMRTFASETYGIPAEQVIGSVVKREVRRENDQLTVWRLPQFEAINDKDDKPVGIDRQIGKRPVLIAGNVFSGGDIAMMEYSKGRKGLSLQLLVNHDDAEREFAYAEKDNFSLDSARRFGFQVVSIKSDWRVVFRGENALRTRSRVHLWSH